MAYSYQYVEEYARWADLTGDLTPDATARRIDDEPDPSYADDISAAFLALARERLAEDRYEIRIDHIKGADGVVVATGVLYGPPHNWDVFARPPEWHRKRLADRLSADQLEDWVSQARDVADEGFDLSREDVYGY